MTYRELTMSLVTRIEVKRRQGEQEETSPLRMTLPSGGTSNGAGGEGGSDGATATTACITPNGAECTQYIVPPEFIADLQFNCAQNEYQVIEVCPTEDLSGACTVVQGPRTVRAFYYGLDAGETTMAEAECDEDMGTWSLTP